MALSARAANAGAGAPPAAAKLSGSPARAGAPVGGDDDGALLLPVRLSGASAAPAGAGAPAPPAAPAPTPSLSAAAAAEASHEVIALLAGPTAPGGAASPPALCMHWANWNALKRSVDEGSPTLVVSFLGDTEVGKSHTIRELMDRVEERPFVQRGREQRASTTFNVNLYSCRSLVPGAVVHLLDFEGENGSEAPLLAGAAGRAGGGAGGAAGAAAGGAAAAASAFLGGLGRLSSALPALAGGGGGGAAAGAPAAPAASASSSSAPPPPLFCRSEAVKEHFPRLAYTTSDVVALVGTDPFFSTRYLERAVDFARRANAGVCDVDLPVLLLLSNKRDGDRCVLDIKASTAQFMDAMGDSFRVLDQYFSALLCVYLPNKRNTTVGDDGAVYDGEALYASQVAKLRAVLAALMRARLAARFGGADGGGAGAGSRLITCRQGLWFDLVPRVVRELNGGRPVHVTRLVDEAWAAAMAGVGAEAEALGDALKALVTGLRPPPGASAAAPPGRANDDALGRFAAFHALALDLAVRLAAARLRHLDPALRLPSRVAGWARAQVEAAVALLDAVTPCAAECRDGGAPVDLPAEPRVLCLTERRVHAKGHRSGRRVRGGGRTLWARAASLVLPHTPAWPGRFEPAPTAPVDVPALLDDVAALVDLPPGDFLAALGAAAAAHSGGYAAVRVVPLGHAGGAGADDAPPPPGAPASGGPPVPLAGPADAARCPPPVPYCMGCARKVVAPRAGGGAAGGGAADDGAGAGAGARAGQPPAPGAAAAWLTAALGALGLAAGGDAPAGGGAPPAPPAGGKRGAGAPRGAARGAPGEGGPRADVAVGLCAECWAGARALNAAAAARRDAAAARLVAVE